MIKGNILNNIIVTRDLSFNELASFYDSLDEEQLYIGNPNNYKKRLDCIIGLFVGSELAGVGGFKKYYGCFPFAFYIIKQRYQGQGLSKILTGIIQNHAIKNRYSFFMCSAYLANKPAISAWTKQGYKLFYQDNEIARFIFPLNSRGKFITSLVTIASPAIFTLRKWLQ